MAINIKAQERKWIANLQKSALVNAADGTFNRMIAYQSFFGKSQADYPDSFPQNFEKVHRERQGLTVTQALETLFQFLDFVGLKLSRESVQRHVEEFPGELEVLWKKSFYILRTLALNGHRLNLTNPFVDNYGDIQFLWRVHSGNPQIGLYEESLHFAQKKLFQLPDGYGSDPIVAKLFTEIEGSQRSFFITGKAGTGKSTFVHYFVQSTKKKVLRLAFTGIAAINIGGQTIHSFFGFPLKPLMPGDDEIKKFWENSEKQRIIRDLDTIVIDEVSMLRSDILDAIDYSLRINGGDASKPFGGKQILFVGDIFQLPPVVESNDEVLQYLFTQIFKSEYFFDSTSYKALSPAYFEFQKSYRQESDDEFVELLDRIRMCDADSELLDRLNKRHFPNFVPKMDAYVINLTSTNGLAEHENSKQLAALDSTLLTFAAKIEGEFPVAKFPTSQVLHLKAGAQVIMIKNDTEQRRWVNGTIGKVHFASDEKLEISLENGEIHDVMREVWENRRYKFDNEKKKIVSEVVGTFSQFPVKLAWAITIHKSQGLTFEKVNIDLGNGAFINGQLYTALSRCRKLNGLSLKRRITPKDIIADHRVLSFHQTEQLLYNLGV